MTDQEAIRMLAKYLLDLSLEVDKLERKIDSLLLTQKHLRECDWSIKTLDEHPEQSISHPDFKR